uniref:Uncharacterized protein n=1 Tax=Faecalibaculum rodentium TaxID=1702221 RepID=A0A140DWY6_9FIRM|nr:hypothetical protein AALO17_20290 [Faecalibaculum rodentium]
MPEWFDTPAKNRLQSDPGDMAAAGFQHQNDAGNGFMPRR